MTKRDPRLQYLLDQHVGNMAGVRRALMVTADGLPRYCSGEPLAEAAEEHMAATASSLGCLARNVATAHGATAWQRLVIDMTLDGEIIRFVVTAVGAAYLAVSARPGTDLAVLSCEVGALAQRLGEHLNAAARPADPRSRGG